MKTLLLLVPLVLAVTACVGPRSTNEIQALMEEARAAQTAEERDAKLAEALAKLTDAMENQPREASDWATTLVLGLLGLGGAAAGTAGVVQARRTATAARSLPNREEIGSTSVAP
jgi:hypothetical protein